MTAPQLEVYGKYQLLELLARGGMAEVFKAKSHGVEGFEKILVIKRILPELSSQPAFVDMFIGEAKISVSLTHANIVQVFDLGRADDQYFIAMEHVAGCDLSTLLAKAHAAGRALPQEIAVYVASELAKGLDYAHRRKDGNLRPLGIVHRDVSPGNVLVSFEGEVKLTDFGIAKARSTLRETTEEGVLKGKYAYMSPEQARAERVDARTDLFALGVVLFECLAGRLPYEAESPYELVQQVREGRRLRLADIAPDTPEELLAIVDRALELDPSARYPNAGALYEDLVQFLYASGRRVGAHDLARVVGELRDVAPARDVDGGAKSAPSVAPPDLSTRRPPPRLAESTGASKQVTVALLRSSPGTLLEEQAFTALCRRYGATLARVIEESERSSTVALLFGAAQPDERDTEWAARFALRASRVGASGTHVGRPIDDIRIVLSVGRMHQGPLGDVAVERSLDELVITAAPLLELADGGGVVVTAETAHALDPLFSTLPLGRDASAPHQLEREYGESDSVGRFVGRRDELRRIGEAFAVANRGEPRVLRVLGEAGAGKTRLILETQRRLKSAGHDVAMFIASSVRGGADLPLSGLQEILRAVLGIDELEEPEVLRERVRRARELGLSSPELGALSSLLGGGTLGESSDALGGVLRTAVARVISSLATDRLTVFCLDDADHLDEESRVVLESALELAPRARFVLTLAHRGEPHGWRDDLPISSVTLDPLDEDDVARLIAARLGAEEIPVELLSEVHAKSGGNPLFVEEYVKSLLDNDLVAVREGRVEFDPERALSTPATLRGLVAARLARLTPAQRATVAVAAIAAPRFPTELVAAVLGETVSQAQNKLLALERRRVIVRLAQSEWRFLHDGLIEVVLDELAADERAALHGRVAGALEQLHPMRLDDLAERLAEHYRRAGDVERAVTYYVRAAERLATEQPGVALRLLEGAIDLSTDAPGDHIDELLELYARYGRVALGARAAGRADERLRRGLDLAAHMPTTPTVARLHLLFGRLMVVAHHVDFALTYIQRAEEMAEELGDGRMIRDAWMARAEADLRRGATRHAIEILSRALARAREEGDVDAQIRCLVHIALAHAQAGERDASLGRIASARELLQQKPDRTVECELCTVECFAHNLAGDVPRGIDAATRGLELARDYGLAYHASIHAHNLGDSYVRLGDYKRAFPQLRYSYEIAREHGIEHILTANLRVLGFIDAMRFGTTEGRTHVVSAMEYAMRKGDHWELVQSRLMLAAIDQQQGRFQGAIEHLHEARACAEREGYAPQLKVIAAAERALRDGRVISFGA